VFENRKKTGEMQKKATLFPDSPFYRLKKFLLKKLCRSHSMMFIVETFHLFLKKNETPSVHHG